MNINTNKKYKKPKQKTQSTTNPGPQRLCKNAGKTPTEPTCPLAAKDSEWVDILQTPSSSEATRSCTHVSDEEEVECEDGPELKPLAIMFPGLLQQDPNTLQGMLDRVMSTTEVTKHLVDLGQKANFTFMKKADRLIPPDKKWLDSLTENSNSVTSMTSALFNCSRSSDYDADIENSLKIDENNELRRKDWRARNIYVENLITKSEIFASIAQMVAEIVQELPIQTI